MGLFTLSDWNPPCFDTNVVYLLFAGAPSPFIGFCAVCWDGRVVIGKHQGFSCPTRLRHHPFVSICSVFAQFACVEKGILIVRFLLWSPFLVLEWNLRQMCPWWGLIAHIIFDLTPHWGMCIDPYFKSPMLCPLWDRLLLNLDLKPEAIISWVRADGWSKNFIHLLVACDQSVMRFCWTFWTFPSPLPSADSILDTRPCYRRQAQLPKFCACFPPRIEMRVPPVSGPTARVTSCTSCKLPRGDVNINCSRSALISYKPLNLHCTAF